ncbi:MAG: hypothetical protein EA385_05130 [Salinarimonadaceae bacterium]|nr:MAG: hypothetical protein EA385_05130 [Salinarimonadaceae bacterium]
MSEPIDELERDVAYARDRLAFAVRGIDARLTPAGLADEAVTGLMNGGGRSGGPSAGRSLAMLAGYAGLKLALGRLTARRKARATPETDDDTGRMKPKEERMSDDRKNEKSDPSSAGGAAGTYSSNPAAEVAENIAENARRVGRRAGSAASDVMNEASDATEDVVDNLRERGREAVDEGLRRGRRGYQRVRRHAAEALDETREQAEHAADWAREGLEDAGAWAEEYYHEAAEIGARGYRQARRFARSNPLAVGAIGLVAGLVVGVLLARGGGNEPLPPRRRTRDDYDRGYDREHRR